MKKSQKVEHVKGATVATFNQRNVKNVLNNPQEGSSNNVNNNDPNQTVDLTALRKERRCQQNHFYKQVHSHECD